MSESLRDLLRQGADTVERPRLDVSDLVARTERRLVRRRLGALAASAASVVLIAAGGLALRPDDERPSPAPPAPDQTEHPLGTPRPLVYAEGATIHFGDETYQADQVVEFVEATDDGFVYITEDSPRLWFTDGSYAADRIGLVAQRHVGEFPVLTTNPGSLVAWEYPGPTPAQREIVVYDSDDHEIVTSPLGSSLIAVNGDRVYWTTGRGERGLMRYDNSTGTQEPVSWSSLRADLASNPRMLVIDGSTRDIAAAAQMSQRLAYFKLVGGRLVATDSVSRGVNGNPTEPTTLADGRPVRLTVPQGYAGTAESLAAVQWLDDGHLVLFAYHGHNEFPAHVGDFLVCPLPTGTCRVVVPVSATPYVPPGDVP